MEELERELGEVRARLSEAESRLADAVATASVARQPSVTGDEGMCVCVSLVGVRLWCICGWARGRVLCLTLSVCGYVGGHLLCGFVGVLMRVLSFQYLKSYVPPI